jgi:DNA repair and recombination RAD54-like protein
LEEALHLHQLDGFKFLSRNLVEEDAGGCMLAFAPGTGKTFLIISFLQSFLIQVPHAKPMVVAPKGMLRPWAQEFKKWEVEEIPIFDLYEANSVESQLDLLQKWQQQERSVLLVGYPQFVNMTGDVGKLLTEGRGLLILDEGHLARTKNTKILTSLMQVRTKRRVLLSGTPFNNNSDEFYHTLELIRPNFMLQTRACLSLTTNSTEVIASEMVVASQSTSIMKPSNGRQAFKDIFGDGIDSGDPKQMTQALRHLRTFIAPFVSWHKGEILDTLPGISDFTVMLHITPMQRRLLDLSEMKNNDNLQKRAAAIYVHPVLEPVSETGNRSQDDLRLQGDVKVRDGAKLRWVLNLVRLCHAAREKLLIFSEYLYSFALIENMTSHRMGWRKGVQIVWLDGKMQPAERESTITRFNSNSESWVLCASVKACGEGISLVGASRVVLLEVS